MTPLLVLNVVGLTKKLLSSGGMPRLAAFCDAHQVRPYSPGLPAVTCRVQADWLCGRPAGGVNGHGAVANGWYFKELAEAWLWRQSAHLLQGSTIHEAWRERYPKSKTAQVFWWWNYPSRADFSVTPRPTYFSDGRKGPDIHAHPSTLRTRLNERLGTFPLFNFWGPGAGIQSTQWIVDAALDILKEEKPGLTLAYLPHLDYDLQRFGPDGKEAQRASSELDREAGRLLDYAEANNIEVIVLSEYGIEEVQEAIFINRALRQAGYLEIHPARNGSLLDPGNSKAFAVCDHQCAHVYVHSENDLNAVRSTLEALPGMDRVYSRTQLQEIGLDHERSGDFFCIAQKGFWFAYPYWLPEEPEPDFARTVDIHNKPGFDPCELFLDPASSPWIPPREQHRTAPGK